MRHVFISYVTEDHELVSVIKQVLEHNGIKVWLDRDSLKPGSRWKDAIRDAINRGTFFVACFSDSYIDREATYMNEELTLAIEQLRLRPHDTSWFIPIRLSNCSIPNRSIGAGETLNDLQRIDLFNDLYEGLQSLYEVLLPSVAPEKIFGMQLHNIIQAKIKHFSDIGAIRLNNIERRWKQLLEEPLLSYITKTYTELAIRARETGRFQIDKAIDPRSIDGRIILLTVCPYDDVDKFLSELPSKNKGSDAYQEFIVEQRSHMRDLPNWEKRDFIHIAHFLGKSEALMDVFYILNASLFFATIGYLKEKQPDGLLVLPEYIYPTTIINSIQGADIIMKMFQEDAQIIQDSR
ncbi:MAG: toll/interleukin-1 receptor domain-containing protein [Xenococcaceae cyanobacterium]